MSNIRRPAPHPSHQQIVSVKGHVKNGHSVKGYVVRRAGLPAAYDPSYLAGASIATPPPLRPMKTDPAGDVGPGVVNGGDPQAGLSGMAW